MNCKDVKGSGGNQVRGGIPSFTGRAEGEHQKLSQHSRSPGGDLNPEPPEQETTVLTIRQGVKISEYYQYRIKRKS
jgi:hypothetical protein